MESSTVFITGAASGIGQACAVEFAKLGAKLILTDRNNLDTARSTCRQLGIPEDRMVCVLGDLEREEDIQRIVQTGLEKFGTVDIVLNVAGVAWLGGIDSPLEEFDIQYRVMLRAVFSICQKLTPYVMKQKGKIINIASVKSSAPFIDTMAYSVVKAALEHFTRCLALELAPHGVTVNSINPGVIETPMHWSLVGWKTGKEAEEYFNQLTALQPVGYNGTAEEVAAAVLYLTSQKAKFITGESLYIDGGLRLKTGYTEH